MGEQREQAHSTRIYSMIDRTLFTPREYSDRLKSILQSTFRQKQLAARTKNVIVS